MKPRPPVTRTRAPLYADSIDTCDTGAECTSGATRRSPSTDTRRNECVAELRYVDLQIAPPRLGCQIPVIQSEGVSQGVVTAVHVILAKYLNDGGVARSEQSREPGAGGRHHELGIGEQPQLLGQRQLTSDHRLEAKRLDQRKDLRFVVEPPRPRVATRNVDTA